MIEIARDAIGSTLDKEEEKEAEHYKGVEYLREEYCTDILFLRNGVQYYIREITGRGEEDIIQWGRSDGKDMTEEEKNWFAGVKEANDVYTYG